MSSTTTKLKHIPVKQVVLLPPEFSTYVPGIYFFMFFLFFFVRFFPNERKNTDLQAINQLADLGKRILLNLSVPHLREQYARGLQCTSPRGKKKPGPIQNASR